MKPRGVFSLPIRSLKTGVSTRSFVLDSEFFNRFGDMDESFLDIHVDLMADRQAGFIMLQFEIYGAVYTACDRCTSDIKLPIQNIHKLYVKFGEGNESDDPDIIYVPADQDQIILDQYLFELTLLAIPEPRIFDCNTIDPKPCDEEVLLKLSREEDKQNEQNPWEALKDLSWDEN